MPTFEGFGLLQGLVLDLKQLLPHVEYEDQLPQPPFIGDAAVQVPPEQGLNSTLIP